MSGGVSQRADAGFTSPLGCRNREEHSLVIVMLRNFKRHNSPICKSQLSNPT